VNVEHRTKRKQFVSITTDSVNHAGWVGGSGSRQLVVRCGGRPQWSASRQAWATSESIAADVLALCDHRNIPVLYTRIGVDDD